MIGGPSGANKTTFIFDLFRTQFRGENFLGHQTYKLPYLVLTGDRGKAAHERTLNRMKIAPDDMPTEICRRSGAMRLSMQFWMLSRRVK